MFTSLSMMVRSSAIGTLFCSMVSRSRIVTQLSFSVVVNGHAERRADGVLAAVALADRVLRSYWQLKSYLRSFITS